MNVLALHSQSTTPNVYIVVQQITHWVGIGPTSVQVFFVGNTSMTIEDMPVDTFTDLLTRAMQN